jgi:asparagine synthase (glutamine-hydrolysing)
VCGIVGCWQQSGASPAALDPWLRQSLDVLAHRGPDAEGVWTDRASGLTLGHRRLAILDLSDAGRQPMANEDGTAVIVHNGEVYNYRELRGRLDHRYRFRSETDTEVILRLYEDKGLDCPAELEGMFAFAIADTSRRRLLLARDRAGVKPMFYCQAPGRLAFASEPRALLGLPWVSAEIDPVAVTQYLTYGYVPAPRTIFRDVRKLPPAHRLVLEHGVASVERYWSLRLRPEPGRPEAAWADELDALLSQVVERQMVSDVPLGAFLSGGVDSSLIVALMTRRASGRVRTFSIGFRGMGYYDERAHARLVARRLGTEHEEFEVEPRAADDLPRILRRFDEPFADSSAIPLYYLAELTRRHVTVALSGTGGDDLFGGYRRHAAGQFAGAVARLPTWSRRALVAATDLVQGSRASRWRELALLLQRLARTAGATSDEAYGRLMSLGDGAMLAALLLEPASGGEDVLAPLLARAGSSDAVERRLYADFHSYLPDDLLVKEDRMSMAWSLEARVPFLDDRLLDFAARLPTHLKVRRLTTKYLLKRVAERYLPAEIVHRPKHGFAVPVAEWLRGPLAGFAREALLEGGSGWLRRGTVETLWREHLAGRDHSGLLYAILAFEVWHREHVQAGTRASRGRG